MWILLWFVSGLIGSVFIALFNESHRSKTLTINEFAMMVIVALSFLLLIGSNGMVIIRYSIGINPIPSKPTIATYKETVRWS
jgi:hypothetical protein